MTCASCQHHVEQALRETAGVESAHVDLMAHRATVLFDPALAAPAQLVEAIRGAGYDAVLPRPGEAGGGHDESQINRDQTRKAAVTLIAGAVAMLLAMPLGQPMGAAGSCAHAVASLALCAPGRVAALVSAGYDGGGGGLGRPRNLCQCPQSPAQRSHQYEHAGGPGHERGVCLLGLRHTVAS